MSRSTIMDLTSACYSFPDLSAPQVQRANILKNIEVMFDEGVRVITIEGIEGIGKTTLLAQFAKAHPNNAFSTFLESSSSWGPDPETVKRDLGNQVEWLLRRRELSDSEKIESADLWRDWYDLRRRARRSDHPFYIIVDGLDEIPDSQGRQEVLDILPLIPGFRFLLSGKLAKLQSLLSRKLTCQQFPLPFFAYHETSAYLAEIGLDDYSLQRLHTASNGTPVNLAWARRMLRAGADINVVAARLDEEISKLFDLEWMQQARNSPEHILLALAAMSLEGRKYSVEELARLSGVEAALLRQELSSLSFVITSDENDSVAFVSDAFRRIAYNKLLEQRRAVSDAVISRLLLTPDSEPTLNQLPQYLYQAGRFEDLLDYLEPSRYAVMLERSQSLAAIKRTAHLAVTASKELRRDADFMRFALQQSVLSELDKLGVWRSEISARMALNDEQSALALANSALLKEDRLQLLAIIAKTKRIEGLAVAPEVDDQIREIYGSLDVDNLGERAVDIASDLVYSHPSLAIELVERSAGSEGDDNALDWAFARLSVTTSWHGIERSPQADGLEEVRSRIRNPDARRFSDAVSPLLRGYSAEEVIVEASKLSLASDQIYLLAHWAAGNRKRDDASSVVEFAVKLVVRESSYVPNANTLRKLATPLPFVSDLTRLDQLISGFETQLGNLQRRGPSDDFVRLQLLLARAECKIDSMRARNRLLDTYVFAQGIEDITTKALCMSRLISEVEGEGVCKDLLTPDEKREIVTDLERDLTDLLAGTADHFRATCDIVESLSLTRPDLAIALVSRLNSPDRRDRVLLHFVHASVRTETARLDFSMLDSVLDQIGSVDIRDKALSAIIARLKRTNKILQADLSKAVPLIHRVALISDAEIRCTALAHAYSILASAKVDNYKSLSEHLLKLLANSWQVIDAGWDKVDSGFQIVEELSGAALDTARMHFDLTEAYRNELNLDNEDGALAYSSCLDLATRAFSGLIRRNAYDRSDLEDLGEAISALPSRAVRAQLWAHVAICFALAGQQAECRRLVTQRVTPLLQDIPSSEKSLKENVTVAIAPALYYAHQQTAKDMCTALTDRARNRALMHICETIFVKLDAYGPYDAVIGQPYDIDYHDILDLCALMELITADSPVYMCIARIASTVSDIQARTKFTEEQKADIVVRLRKVAQRAFPNPKYIAHDGYKIAAEAQIARIRGISKDDWDSLIDAATKIPNAADAPFVVSMVAESMPARLGNRRLDVLRQAKDMIGNIPSSLDRIERYESLAQTASEFDSELPKECLRAAMQYAVAGDDGDHIDAQRRLVDLARKFDKDGAFAASLLSYTDDDPARAKVRQNIRHRIRFQEDRQKIIDTLTNRDGLRSFPKEDLPELLWSLLGSLRAKRMPAASMESMLKVIEIAASLPFSQSYVAYFWVLENLTRRMAQTDQALTYLRPLYRAVLQCAPMVRAISARSSAQLERVRTRPTAPVADRSIIVRAGNREFAVEYLTKWLEDNARGYLKICDPYFGPTDLEILQLLNSVNAICNVSRVAVLSSQRFHDDEKIDNPQFTYRTTWRMRMSEQTPPRTRIVIVGQEPGGSLPIHDRWWLTDGAGISLGTSFSGLGRERDSAITVLTATEARAREEEVDLYFEMTQQEHNGHRVLYSSFDL